MCNLGVDPDPLHSLPSHLNVKARATGVGFTITNPGPDRGEKATTSHVHGLTLPTSHLSISAWAHITDTWPRLERDFQIASPKCNLAPGTPCHGRGRQRSSIWPRHSSWFVRRREGGERTPASQPWGKGRSSRKRWPSMRMLQRGGHREFLERVLGWRKTCCLRAGRTNSLLPSVLGLIGVRPRSRWGLLVRANRGIQVCECRMPSRRRWLLSAMWGGTQMSFLHS